MLYLVITLCIGVIKMYRKGSIRILLAMEYQRNTLSKNRLNLAYRHHYLFCFLSNLDRRKENIALKLGDFFDNNILRVQYTLLSIANIMFVKQSMSVLIS